jgi:hypothetical protein
VTHEDSASAADPVGSRNFEVCHRARAFVHSAGRTHERIAEFLESLAGKQER